VTAPEPEPYEQFGLAFKTAMASVRRLRGRETHHPGELSYAQYGVLFSLAHVGPLPARDVADLADLSPATATQMLDGLARAGLVERVRSLEDKRVVLSSLTDRGRELVEERRGFFDERWREALAAFSDEQLTAAAEMLERIAQLFDEIPASPPAAPSKAAA
jgi:DNA-binding MarR family transcriptional regulator